MYVIIAKKDASDHQKGFQRQDNMVVIKVVPSVDQDHEAALQATLNDLVNEGERGDHHEIIQVLWKA